MNPDDSSFFPAHDGLRQRENAERRGLLLTGTEHPLQKLHERDSLGVVRDVSRDDKNHVNDAMG